MKKKAKRFIRTCLSRNQDLASGLQPFSFLSFATEMLSRSRFQDGRKGARLPLFIGGESQLEVPSKVEWGSQDVFTP
jgi:hypothetical protein